MIYGLYLSATGAMTQSHRLDVVANNLANAETTGFKRQLALLQERPPEAREPGPPRTGDRLLDQITGGQLLAPSTFDLSQGSLERTEGRLDLAVNGKGYFAVKDASNNLRLTRNGQFMLDRDGFVVHSTDNALKILDTAQQPIRLPGLSQDQLTINDDGSISANGQIVSRVGLFNVPDERLLRPAGGTLLNAPPSVSVSSIEQPSVIAGYVERSNVDPAVELTRLIEIQRTLEANANMIRYQDQTLARLVNDVGRVG